MECNKSPQIIGIFLDRTIDLICSIFSILKLKSIYLPIDTKLPKDRIKYMLEESKFNTIITNSNHIDFIKNEIGFEGAIINININEKPIIYQKFKGNTKLELPMESGYILYTSGSTGKPKGVLIPEKNILNFIYYWIKEKGKDLDDFRVTLFSTTIIFDVSMEQIFLPLLSGNSLVIINHIFDLEDRKPIYNEITFLSTVPTALIELINMKAIPTSLKSLHVGGEALPYSLMTKLLSIPHLKSIYNTYGPTGKNSFIQFFLLLI